MVYLEARYLLRAKLDPAKPRPKFMNISHRPVGRLVWGEGQGHKILSPGLFTIVASIHIHFSQTP
jgi:hypothetical protein